ncbi:MAG: orotate phosphoribosyltransferase [Haliscomenobacter sp.]
MSIASEVALQLLQIKAIMLSPQKPFTWASGLSSPIYCDNRMVLSHPEARSVIVDKMAEMAKTLPPFEVVAGVATAGIPHGILLADRLGLPFVYVREKPKGHGRQNLIEGELRPAASVLLVEDLISTGGSSLRAVQSLREAGAQVVGVLAIFSYNFPEAAQAFAEAACPLYTLSQYEVLLEEALQTGYISAENRELLSDWRLNPKAWSAAYQEGRQQ